MRLQFDFFEREGRKIRGNLPEGLHYQPDLIGPSEEDALVARIRELPFVSLSFMVTSGSAGSFCLGGTMISPGSGFVRRKTFPNISGGSDTRCTAGEPQAG